MKHHYHHQCSPSIPRTPSLIRILYHIYYLSHSFATLNLITNTLFCPADHRRRSVYFDSVDSFGVWIRGMGQHSEYTSLLRRSLHTDNCLVYCYDCFISRMLQRINGAQSGATFGKQLSSVGCAIFSSIHLFRFGCVKVLNTMLRPVFRNPIPLLSAHVCMCLGRIIIWCDIDAVDARICARFGNSSKRKSRWLHYATQYVDCARKKGCGRQRKRAH